jgi:hypothetical protein
MDRGIIPGSPSRGGSSQTLDAEETPPNRLRPDLDDRAGVDRGDEPIAPSTPSLEFRCRHDHLVHRSPNFVAGAFQSIGQLVTVRVPTTSRSMSESGLSVP